MNEINLNKLYKILDFISNNNLCTVKDIMSQLNISESTTRRHIDFAHSKALIHIRNGSNRVKSFMLLDKGVDFCNHFFEVRQLIGDLD